MNVVNYNKNNKPKLGNIHPIGTEVCFASSLGGGSYIVVGVVNCSRCKTEVELREVQTPNRKQKRRGYYSEYSWCYNCGLYEPNVNTRVSV